MPRSGPPSPNMLPDSTAQRPKLLRKCCLQTTWGIKKKQKGKKSRSTIAVPLVGHSLQLLRIAWCRSSPPWSNFRLGTPDLDLRTVRLQVRLPMASSPRTFHGIFCPKKASVASKRAGLLPKHRGKIWRQASQLRLSAEAFPNDHQLHHPGPTLKTWKAVNFRSGTRLSCNFSI